MILLGCLNMSSLLCDNSMSSLQKHPCMHNGSAMSASSRWTVLSRRLAFSAGATAAGPSHAGGAAAGASPAGASADSPAAQEADEDGDEDMDSEMAEALRRSMEE